MVVASMVAMIAGKDSEMAYCLSSVVLDVAVSSQYILYAKCTAM